MNIRSDSTENYIIDVLAKRHQMTIQALQKEIEKKHWTTISSAKMYRIINRLINEYVLIKESWLVKLNGLRVTYCYEYSKKLLISYKEHETVEELPKDIDYYYAHSLNELEWIWTDMTAKILTNISCDTLFFYDSHLYYMLWIFDTWTKVYKNLLQKENTILYLVGSSSFLDKYASWFSKNEQIHIHHINNSPFTQSGYSLRIFWDYFIEVYIPENIVHFFDQFFDTITSIDQFDADLYKSLFSMKAKCTLRIHHNKKLADNYRTTLQTLAFRNKNI